MTELVLDTHALAWWLARPRKLGRGAQRALREVERGRARAFIPSIVGVELTLLNEAGRFELGVLELEAVIERSPWVTILPHDLAQAREFSRLRSLGDPFDRMIVAAARATRRPLLTADRSIAESGLVEVIWA